MLIVYTGFAAVSRSSGWDLTEMILKKGAG